MKKIYFLMLCSIFNLQSMTCLQSNELDSCSSLSSVNSSVNVLEKVLPTVVLIITKIKYFDVLHGPNPTFFYDTIRPVYEWMWPPVSGFSGSGFFISPDGYIVTNNHVIRNATEVLVVVQNADCRIMQAEIIGKDPRTDIAVLKIETNNYQFPYLNFADSNKVKIGEMVMAIGTPLPPQLESTVTRGIVSGKNRTGLGGIIEGYIQTDASLNGGNSGGPLVNLKGEIVGVTNTSYCWSSFLEGLGFAIPSNTVKQISQQLICKGRALQGFLGVELDQTKAETFDLNLISLNNGAFIYTVVQDSPAEQAGLKSNDQIIELNGHNIKSSQELKNQICILDPDTEIELTVCRQNKKFLITIILGEDDLAKKYFSIGQRLVI